MSKGDDMSYHKIIYSNTNTGSQKVIRFHHYSFLAGVLMYPLGKMSQGIRIKK